MRQDDEKMPKKNPIFFKNFVKKYFVQWWHSTAQHSMKENSIQGTRAYNILAHVSYKYFFIHIFVQLT